MTAETLKAPGGVRWLLPLLLLLTAGGVGAFLLLRGEGDVQAAPPPPVPVLVQPVGSGDRALSFEVSGEVEARSTVNIGFRIPGVVARVLVEEGQSVGVGQLLAELDGQEYRLNLGLAEAQMELATDAHRRATQLHGEAGLPQAEFVRAGVALRQATLQHEVALKHVEDTRLVAPASGVVARRGIHPGEQAGPGVPVFTIVSIHPAQVRVGVPEAEIGSVRVGQSATVRLPALPGTVLEGRVEMVGVLADPVSRSYAVKIGLSNADGILRPGMIAEARILDDARVQMHTIPGEAVVLDTDGLPLVYVYDPVEERVHSRRIRVGSPFGEEIEVVSGLEGGELVVVGGQHRVRDGSRVEATRRPAAGGTSPQGAP